MYNDRDGSTAELRIEGLSKTKCLQIMEAIKKYDVRIEMTIVHSNYAGIIIYCLLDKVTDFQKAVEKANNIFSGKSLLGKKAENVF